MKSRDEILKLMGKETPQMTTQKLIDSIGNQIEIAAKNGERKTTIVFKEEDDEIIELVMRELYEKGFHMIKDFSSVNTRLIIKW